MAAADEDPPPSKPPDQAEAPSVNEKGKEVDAISEKPDVQENGEKQPAKDERPSTPLNKEKEDGQPTDTPQSASSAKDKILRRRVSSGASRPGAPATTTTNVAQFISTSSTTHAVSEWSHQQLAPPVEEVAEEEQEVEWQEMPAYAPYDIYDDDGKLIAKESEIETGVGYAQVGSGGGTSKGYTKVQIDEDAQSATSMDDNTAYLFKERGVDLDIDEDAPDASEQMQTTKTLLTENERIAYVGVVRLAMVNMAEEVTNIEKTKNSKKLVDLAGEALQLWTQKMMVRIYGHMDVSSAEQLMIEQLAEHGLRASDLTPTLMRNARVKNPARENEEVETMDADASESEPPTNPEEPSDLEEPSKLEELSKLEEKANPGAPSKTEEASKSNHENGGINHSDRSAEESPPPPPYTEHAVAELSTVENFKVQLPSQLPTSDKIDIDIRWTVLCDLFLVLISDSIYDARSRTLLEKVGLFLEVPSLDICRFEKRVTDALEMEEESAKEDLDETDHIESRRKMARKRRLVMMGLATVGGSLVIGLSAGLLAPVIGAGLAAGFTTIGVAGTEAFLGGAAASAIIGTTSAVAGGAIGVRAANRRTGAVKTFEYRPLHNNKRVNLIVTVSGWMTGKVDDVRLPFSTVDPIMGDLYSVLWEPDMLRSMGDTINILATEALTQGLQQVLGSTILISLMAALQLPIVLTKLSYLIDNPWSNSLARADIGGLILADSLIDRNLGARPVTLVGFSLGSRLIFACLKELAKKGALGLVQNVYLFGSPIVVKKDEYLRIRTVVAGRFVNGYATNDWILGYLFRATSGGIGRVAGLAKVDIPGIENYNCTEDVPGHMAYRTAMPKLLRKIGWAVESDEFTEIDDPNPENHEARRRELINEIEEAKKELDKKPEKKKWGLFGWTKKSAQKKELEAYDENEGTTEPSGGSGALFDVEAIRKEAAQIAAQAQQMKKEEEEQEIEIKELESTMPPMKLDSTALLSPGKTGEERPTFRETKSCDAVPQVSGSLENPSPSKSFDKGSRSVYSGSHGQGVTLSFDSAPGHFGGQQALSATSSTFPSASDNEEGQPRGQVSANQEYKGAAETPPSTPPRSLPSQSVERSPRVSRSPSPATAASFSDIQKAPRTPSPVKQTHDLPHPAEDKEATARASISSAIYSSPDLGSGRNVWVDDEDENDGNDREIQMTFE